MGTLSVKPLESSVNLEQQRALIARASLCDTETVSIK